MNLKPISRNIRVLVVLLAASSLTLGACSNNVKQPSSTDGKVSEKEKLAPVKLSFFNGGATVWPEDQFRTYIEQPVRQKYPHITIEYITGTDKDLENLITTGNVPDIVTSGPSSLFGFINLGITADMTPLVTRSKFDLGRLEDQAVDFIKKHSANGELLSIPVTRDSNVLYYNKDLFDKFGVAYPTDFMSWDETYELAKKLVREDGGTKYRGFDLQLNTFRHMAK
ncbi:ABC transporter substrate-binding protein [Paenibacillus hodogayensis]|uniref:ABC transporter substrate-binding protein n=1 Tax=Paenibacillus hodogayensis TaxID=279208 RepID=A0ABV5VQV5_9BACL